MGKVVDAWTLLKREVVERTAAIFPTSASKFALEYARGLEHPLFVCRNGAIRVFEAKNPYNVLLIGEVCDETPANSEGLPQAAAVGVGQPTQPGGDCDSGIGGGSIQADADDR